MSSDHDDVVEARGGDDELNGEVAETQAEPTAQGSESEPAEVEDSMLTMDELMARHEASAPLQELREGDVVIGTVVQIDDQCAMVDIGTKSEGMIQKNELDEIRDEISVGDKLEVCVYRIEDEDGNLIVSKRQADYERAWEDIVDKENSAEIMEAKVVEAVKGGLLVDLGLYGQGFVPASHVSIRRPRNLGKYVGQTLRLQVIEVERKRKRVVLSHRKVLEEERAAEREDTLETLREGQVRTGVVRRITDFGAFVDIGGVDGLLHISEMSWNRIGDPGELLSVNDDVDVMVLKLNLDEGRISLGLRQLQSDPWREIPKIYREHQIIRARIQRLLNDGLVVRLPIGVDGFVPVPEEMKEAFAGGAPDGDESEGEAAEGAAAESEAVEGEAAEAESEGEAAEAAEREAVEAESEADVAEADVVEPESEGEAAEAEGEAFKAEAEGEVADGEAVEAESEGETAEGQAVEVASDDVAEGEAGEAASDGEADETGFQVGAEIEVRIDRILPVDRELELTLASLSPVMEPSAEEDGEGAPRSRYTSGRGAPLARGRYSDRAQEADDRSGRAQQPSARRDRRRDRDDDRVDREREPSVPEQAPPPARRTLGDLMGDKLRSLFQDDEAEEDEVAGGESESSEESEKDEPADEAN